MSELENYKSKKLEIDFLREIERDWGIDWPREWMNGKKKERKENIFLTIEEDYFYKVI